jgi:hypothetical protein
MRLCIVSGATHHRFYADTNQRIYAKRHGYDYRFDMGPYDLGTHMARRKVGFFKISAVERALPDFDWVFWIDDDAFFTDFDKPLAPFLDGIGPDVFWVACKSPVNPEGRWSYLSSGQFFIRNCEESFAFLRTVRNVPPEVIKPWWDEQKVGLSTTGDQDAFVYTLLTDNLLPRVRLMEYQTFNNRWYHYEERLNEHLIVHFAGAEKQKRLDIANFAAKFGLDESLVPRSLLREYGVPPRHMANFALRFGLNEGLIPQSLLREYGVAPSRFPHLLDSSRFLAPTRRLWQRLAGE